MARIFISYRREDSMAHAGRLYDRLASKFGESQVFMDIDTILPGVDFVLALENAVVSCGTLLAVIGRNWLNVTDEAGRRRIENPDDFVRIEISTALKNSIYVIPVLVGGSRMPKSDELPPDLSPLARRQAQDLPDMSF